jgi:MraZ protein
MFRGRFEHTIDDKGRLSIPAKFREELGKDKTIVLVGMESYLSVFPMKAWRGIEDRLKTGPTFRKDIRDFLRNVYSSAEDAEIDPQGRVLIPQGLRQKAKISRDVVLIGAMDLIEIWDKPQWEAQATSATPAMESMARLGELGV